MHDRNISQSFPSVVPLARFISAEMLKQNQPCDTRINCFEFRPGEETTHLPSAVLRWFKSQPCQPNPSRQLSSFCDQCASLILPRIPHPDYVIATLSSWQTAFIETTPLGQLASTLCRASSAQLIQPFRRTSPRRPMSMTPTLSGIDAIVSRKRYVASTLVCDRTDLSGRTVMVIDDIGCTGATSSVHTCALKQICACEKVVWVNLGQAVPFQSDIQFDLVDLPMRRESSDFQKKVWWERQAEMFHCHPGCQAITTDAQQWWKGLLSHTVRKCRRCT